MDHTAAGNEPSSPRPVLSPSNLNNYSESDARHTESRTPSQAHSPASLGGAPSHPGWSPIQRMKIDHLLGSPRSPWSPRSLMGRSAATQIGPQRFTSELHLLFCIRLFQIIFTHRFVALLEKPAIGRGFCMVSRANVVFIRFSPLCAANRETVSIKTSQDIFFSRYNLQNVLQPNPPIDALGSMTFDSVGYIAFCDIGAMQIVSTTTTSRSQANPTRPILSIFWGTIPWRSTTIDVSRIQRAQAQQTGWLA